MESSYFGSHKTLRQVLLMMPRTDVSTGVQKSSASFKQ